MANPVGEDNWLAYIEEMTRHATDLEGRVKVVEAFKDAIGSELPSMKIWLNYCEYFWSLFMDCKNPDAGWLEEERLLGQQLFSFDSALSLWSQGYEAIKFRLSDSHEFWNRWVSIEMEQLALTRTPVGVKRITHLFRARLQTPHSTWDDTSQMFSSFLSSYNNAAYESEFQEVVASAKEAKDVYELREPFELKLKRAVKSGDDDAQRDVLKEYLDFEMIQIVKTKNPVLALELCLGLYSRALAGIATADEDIWSNYAVYLSDQYHHANRPELRQALPNLLTVLERATLHCPSSGWLWSRYILTAEEAGLPFQQVERIKHAATDCNALDKNGMTSVLDMYSAWCGYLKRTAMNPNAPEDAADVAELGLSAALEDVELWGKRLYKDDYRGDPGYRLERILIQYLTEVRGHVDEARDHWNKMAAKPILADSYDFWLNYYLWEMMIFASSPRPRSPTPATPAGGAKTMRVPGLATNVLQRSVERKTLDWPERVIEVCLQHCNDYEDPVTVRRTLDKVHKARKGIAKRREREQAQAAAAYAAQVQDAQQYQYGPTTQDAPASQNSPSGSKRKREGTPEDVASGSSKRVRNVESNGLASESSQEHTSKRDRENTCIMVTNLPGDATQTAIKKYFKEYGHIANLDTNKENDGTSVSALIEFNSPDDVQSALLKDNKYFGSSQISVKPAAGLTIFVSNFPPAADEAYLRDLYKSCGEIFSIRWPSLRFNTHRRFCYISFRDSEAAYKATQLDGQLLEKQYRLQSKYSDPGNKKQRQGAVAEHREIQIRNLDFSATEEDLKSVCGKYGKIANVKIVKNMKGKNTGLAYVVFETREQAESSMELNQTKFKSQILQVSVTKETNFKLSATSKGQQAAGSPGDGDVAMEDRSNHSAPAKDPSAMEIQQRSIAIMDIPDTINDARIRAVIEKSGEIIKLTLRPDHRGAIVEFADAATAGRMALTLDGHEILPGQKIRTGGVQELKKQKFNQQASNPADAAPAPAKKPAFMPPPTTVRRPGPAKGRGGPKRGLGFASAASAASKKDEGTATTNGAPKPKSNADFRAMFVSGEENKKPEESGS